MKYNLLVELPIIMTASDYHDFDVYLDVFKKVHKDIKYEELSGLLGRDYGAIFYLDKNKEFYDMISDWEKIDG